MYNKAIYILYILFFFPLSEHWRISVLRSLQLTFSDNAALKYSCSIFY